MKKLIITAIIALISQVEIKANNLEVSTKTGIIKANKNEVNTKTGIVKANDLEIITKISNNDSLKINIDNRTKSIVAVDNKGVTGYSLKGDLRTLFKSKDMELTDEIWESIRNEVNSEIAKDTVLIISQNGKQIQIAINNKTFEKNSDEKISSADRPAKNDDYNSNWSTGGKNNNGDNVKVGKDGIHISDGSDEVHITKNGIKIVDGGNDIINIGTDPTDSVATAKTIERKSLGSLAGFNIDLGLNNFTGKPGASYNADSYAIRPFGARYFAMGWMRSGDVTHGKNARLKIAIGLNFSWYNFMLDNNKIWTKGPTKVEFLDSPKALSKTKLTISYIDIPLIPYIAFKKGNFVEYIGAGGYVGYRLGAHSKTKTEDRGKKDKEFNNFYLNNFKYGLTFQLGLHNFPDLFVNYDLNPLFKENKGPGVSGLSFGIKF